MPRTAPTTHLADLSKVARDMPGLEARIATLEREIANLRGVLDPGPRLQQLGDKIPKEHDQRQRLIDRLGTVERGVQNETNERKTKHHALETGLAATNTKLTELDEKHVLVEKAWAKLVNQQMTINERVDKLKTDMDEFTGRLEEHYRDLAGKLSERTDALTEESKNAIVGELEASKTALTEKVDEATMGLIAEINKAGARLDEIIANLDEKQLERFTKYAFTEARRNTKAWIDQHFGSLVKKVLHDVMVPSIKLLDTIYVDPRTEDATAARLGTALVALKTALKPEPGERENFNDWMLADEPPEDAHEPLR
jgi:chromosome segregation ATPase